MASPAGQNNTFLPQVTKNLIINYSRNPKDFAVSQLYKLMPVERMVGRFPKIRPQEASRLLTTNARLWEDGAARPVTEFNKAQFDWISYQTARYSEAIPMGDLSTDQADFPIMQAQADQLAMRAMTFRSKLFYNILTTSGNYLSGYTGNASSLGGGVWTNATTTNRYIQKSLQAAARVIELGTNGAVRYTDLTLVMGPTVAQALAASSEFAESIMQSQYAEELVKGDGKLTASYGLPSKIYGMNVVVDPTIETTTNVNSAGTSTQSYQAGTTGAFLIARPGGLVNNAGIASDFATIACFCYKGQEMYAETIPDPVNQRKLLSVTDNIAMQLVAPETAFWITTNA